MRNRFSFGVLLGYLLSLGAMAQAVSPTNGAKTSASVSGPDSQLAEENEYFRVTKVQLPPGTAGEVGHRDRDAVFLTLGKGLTVSREKTGASDDLREGEVRFLPRESSLQIANTGTSLTQLLVVELKRHWDGEIRPCSEFSKCTRPIRIRDLTIGETTSVFTNGFITSYRHRLDRGGTLSSSYFSSKGKNHVLLIALTGLQANFDGAEESLQRGQTYASDATGVEVDASKGESQWVVVRMHIPGN